jgi:hypothetical protein
MKKCPLKIASKDMLFGHQMTFVPLDQIRVLLEFAASPASTGRPDHE